MYFCSFIFLSETCFQELFWRDPSSERYWDFPWTAHFTSWTPGDKLRGDCWCYVKGNYYWFWWWGNKFWRCQNCLFHSRFRSDKINFHQLDKCWGNLYLVYNTDNVYWLMDSKLSRCFSTSEKQCSDDFWFKPLAKICFKCAYMSWFNKLYLKFYFSFLCRREC